ncbi:Light-independent protochlorophyllide reductase subunit B [Frankliniella fusca]|uniref:Light-independent protochlorophyllide reductase subunit B n=1 Tax=Frankliniella fusca TaxID=407009 RepID=A0AAE1GVR5_9NEOP|nr:Light-independent protochlorophyllide reductase subunit B [Frankliniella fusca]
MTSDVDILIPKKPQLAKKVLAYMLIGLYNNIHKVVGLFSTTDVTAVQIYSRTWDVIYNLEAMGLKIICLICDGAGSNKKFFSMHKSWNESAEYRDVEEKPSAFLEGSRKVI